MIDRLFLGLLTLCVLAGGATALASRWASEERPAAAVVQPANAGPACAPTRQAAAAPSVAPRRS